MFIELLECLQEKLDDIVLVSSCIVEEITKVPKKVVGKVTDFAIDVYDNGETVAILVLATVGASVIVGKIIFKIPVPSCVERKLLAPVISVIIVKKIAQSAERRSLRVDEQQNISERGAALFQGNT